MIKISAWPCRLLEDVKLKPFGIEGFEHREEIEKQLAPWSMKPEMIHKQESLELSAIQVCVSLDLIINLDPRPLAC